MKKRIILVLILMLFFIVPLRVKADGQTDAPDSIEVSGTYRDAVKWKIKDKTLIIYGKGAAGEGADEKGVLKEEYVYPWSAYADSVTKVIIKEGITYIGMETFKNFNNLISVKIADSVTEIDASAFYSCQKLKKINLPDGLASIERDTFCGCSSLSDIALPETLNYIGKSAFGDCSTLARIDIPDSVKKIDANAFNGCSALTSVHLSDSLTSIDDYAFNGCSNLTNIELPDHLTNIGDGAFADCSSLKSICIPEGIKIIRNYVFDYCKNLVSVCIPTTVVDIYPGFYKCGSLRNVYYAGSEEQWEKIDISQFASSNLERVMVYYDTKNAEEAKLEKGRVAVAVGKRITLPKIEGKNFVYHSEDTSILKVNKTTGKIRGITEGKTKVTISYMDESGKEQTGYYRIYVTNPVYNPPSRRLVVGNYYTPSFSGLAKVSKITISSGDPSVISADWGSDTYYMVDQGTAVLTITADGVVFEQEVQVVDPYPENDAMLLVVGKSGKIKFPGLPEDASVKYILSDKSVVTVSKTGKFTAKKAGSTYVKVTVTLTENGKSAKYDSYCKIIVVDSSAMGVKAVQKADSVVGSLYSQEKRMQTGYYDCSSLVWRAYKAAGKNLGGFTTAPTAAELAKRLESQGKVISYKALKPEKLQPGDLIFYKTGDKNRYKSIGHVAMYYGTYEEVLYLDGYTNMESMFNAIFGNNSDESTTKGLVIDAMPFFDGVSIHDYYSEESIVMIVRP